MSAYPSEFSALIRNNKASIYKLLIEDYIRKGLRRVKVIQVQLCKDISNTLYSLLHNHRVPSTDRSQVVITTQVIDVIMDFFQE